MRPPYFWSAGLDPASRDAAPMLRFLLTPVAALYARAIDQKLKSTMPGRTGVPVICVGNLTVGGSGKTPVVAEIVSRFHAMGVRAASLSRGYGGRLRGPSKVDPAAHMAKDVGDEPLMLAAKGEAWIGRDRFGAAEEMVRAGVGAIVMDDGHQNPSLHKDLSCVVVDAGAPFGNGFVLPKGPLREPVAAGFARAQVILLSGEGDVPEPVLATGKPVLRFTLTPVAAAPDGPLLAFAGIGRPAKFFDALTRAGGDVCDGISFDDHHPYTDGDLKHLRSLASHLKARLVTTEKDFARLPVSLRDNILTFPVRARFDDPEGLDALLRAVLAGAPS